MQLHTAADALNNAALVTQAASPLPDPVVLQGCAAESAGFIAANMSLPAVQPPGANDHALNLTWHMESQCLT
eukprot:CAMPEP_0196665806 /NCGR_PEP_ID=MMETSP1086-20130531/62638_1 /TAXON_ID=77921 /ORGANISM="Cyanoptyche  gloeocystis , Strain SAG4.97" /LENGTH=71 /DNA_ID=CAMNT_0042002749 /DNA_START=97 /DNA_END=308 /DNA_ORIENTATION=+